MKELNNKEEELKNILGDLEIDIDTNDIWDNIESDLPTQEKKRRYGFFWLVGLFIIGLAGGIFFSLQDAEANTEQSASHTEHIASTLTDILTVDKNINNAKNKSAENNNPSEKKHLRKVGNSTTKEVSKASINPVINPFDTETTSSISNQPILTQNETISNVEKLASTQLIPSTLAQTTTEKPNASRALFDNVNQLSTLTAQVLDIIERAPIVANPTYIEPLSHSRQLILQMKIGTNKNQTTIDNITSNGEFDESEFDFERDRIGVSGSLAIGVENKGWRFLAGIAYHHHVSTYERDDIQISTDPVSGIEYYSIDANDQVISHTGTTTVTEVRHIDINYHRQHRAIDFYATMGKRLWSYKGFVLSADAGLGINTNTSSSGYYLADQALGFTKFQNDEHPYKINTHWNAIASVELGYNLGKTRIGLSPFIRYNPNSITDNSHLYTLKNSQVGMQLSLTYSPTRE